MDKVTWTPELWPDLLPGSQLCGLNSHFDLLLVIVLRYQRVCVTTVQWKEHIREKLDMISCNMYNSSFQLHHTWPFRDNHSHHSPSKTLRILQVYFIHYFWWVVCNTNQWKQLWTADNSGGNKSKIFVYSIDKENFLIKSTTWISWGPNSLQ